MIKKLQDIKEASLAFSKTEYERFNLTNVKSGSENLNWVFSPAGPGFSAHYLYSFVRKMPLEGSLWILDFPDFYFKNPKEESYLYSDIFTSNFLTILENMPNCIFVGHSFSGMFALSIPQVESYLKGLVIISGAPHNEWLRTLPLRAGNRGVPDPSFIKNFYKNNLSDAHLKKFTEFCHPYFFNPQEKKELGNEVLKELRYNYQIYEWGDNYFYPFYKAAWVPTRIKTLIIGGTEDIITPLEFFKSDDRFLRKNIQFSEIEKGAHFPWIENFEDVKKALLEFSFQVKGSIKSFSES